MHCVTLVGVLLGLAVSTLAVHHHRGPASRWDDDDGLPRHRHPLRHHGQDAPVAVAAPPPPEATTSPAGSGLDQLINRLDSMNRVEPHGAHGYSPSYKAGYGHWKHRGEEDSDNQIALEELQQVAEEYERGEVMPDARTRTSSPGRLRNAAESKTRHDGQLGGSARYRHRVDALLDDDDEEDREEEDDEENDDDDRNFQDSRDDKEDSEEDVNDSGQDSEEVDKGVSREVEDMLHMDYRDAPRADLSQQALSDSPPPYSSYSEQKWSNYGTRESLAHTRRHGPRPELHTTERLAKEATNHMRMMGREGTCKVPKPMVVTVQQVYPDPSKEYLPYCTILHRCTDATGCCRSPRLTCAPKASATHKVVLPFYTKRVDQNQAIVETLVFYNETECECAPREDSPRMDAWPSSSSSSSLPARKQRQTRTQLDMPNAYIHVAPYTKTGCRCPSTFSPRELTSVPKGCTCDCFDRQTDCLRYKRGKEYFSLEDRLCIQTSQCKLPECEFGAYMKLSGRCPKKNEKFSHYYYHHRRP